MVKGKRQMLRPLRLRHAIKQVSGQVRYTVIDEREPRGPRYSRGRVGADNAFLRPFSLLAFHLHRRLVNVHISDAISPEGRLNLHGP